MEPDNLSLVSIYFGSCEEDVLVQVVWKSLTVGVLM